MKRILSIIAIVAVMGMTTGCYKVTFVRNVAPQGGRTSQWNHFFILGLFGNTDVNVKKFCPDGNVRMIRTGASLGTAFATIITVGLYTPRKMWVQCGSGGSSASAPIDFNLEGELAMEDGQ